ncbi:putative spermidine/putrescine transport system substrate-binding protein [Halobacillus dabanensis]|uniref:Putative spermidine/putrescine transport system substrate-binding protein n=1 Tax=Halobacillus dabanensis TaxID=240302 RepID=A0A1I3Z002_HALDA|nr:ABC transporter substrate-binding protein [Halobacillus dabanensis]SFK36826.1 putative spermidine/putrescine transport system substrate-binding protein [Halobacillus dabanensis]
MKRKISYLLLVFLLLSACSQASTSERDWTKPSWDEITSEAEGTEVRLYMWGGDEGINQYIDEWVTPRMKENHGLTLERVPMDTPEILQKLQTEKQAGKQEGTIDLIWINGENFKNAKENGLLMGSFTHTLPNFTDYYDTNSPAFQTDFGTAVDGMEAPWGKVQFVFHYDSDKIEDPPASFEELHAWIHNNPGKFTYPRAEDFTGNAFLRHILYAQAGEPEDIYGQPLEEERIAETAQHTWTYLNDITGDLWRSGEHYPNSLTELDRLYSQGEVWMTMGYNESRAESLIEEGVFPESTRSFVMEPGSIGNTHFLSIPFNSQNRPGALTAINEMLSPEAQLAKFKPKYWGENTPISFEKLSEEMRKQFKTVERGKSVLPPEKLEKSFLPESEAAYVELMREQWFNEVVQK